MFLQNSGAVWPLERQAATRAAHFACVVVMHSDLCRMAPLAKDGAHAADTPIEQYDPVWLLMEWPDDEEEPTKFALTTLPARMSKKDRSDFQGTVSHRASLRGVKGELGLDHFEGRRFRGWHHHLTAVLSCYAFVVAERVRPFPPSAAGARCPGSLALAA